MFGGWSPPHSHLTPPPSRCGCTPSCPEPLPEEPWQAAYRKASAGEHCGTCWGYGWSGSYERYHEPLASWLESTAVIRAEVLKELRLRNVLPTG